MSDMQLPERPSLEYLKKLAKERLQHLRRSNPNAKLAAALLAVARDHGFPSWRALKEEVEKRLQTNVEQFFEAAKQGHDDVVRRLLQQGADPNVREDGDNTTPLHWAAAKGHIDVVRTLLDAGADVHGVGDVHTLDVIGWATFFSSLKNDADRRGRLVDLLLERGARHHIFSAMSMGDLDLIRKLVEENPDALDRRMSRFEQGQTPLHFAMNQKRYDMLDLLLELGADVEAVDKNGQTPLVLAMLRGDQTAIKSLIAAGAKQPPAISAGDFVSGMQKLAPSIAKGVPMICVPDVARTMDWYASIGFREIARYDDDGVVNFGMVAFGEAELMLNLYGDPAPGNVSLWFYTDKIDALYQLLKARQLKAGGIEFEQDIEDMFYGARQFGIRDLNGYVLYFIQSV